VRKMGSKNGVRVEFPLPLLALSAGVRRKFDSDPVFRVRRESTLTPFFAATECKQ